MKIQSKNTDITSAAQCDTTSRHYILKYLHKTPIQIYEDEGEELQSGQCICQSQGHHQELIMAGVSPIT